MQNSTPHKDEIRSTIQSEQVPISGGSFSNSDSWLFISQNSLPINSHWTSMGADIDSSADCKYESSVPQEQNFHQKLMTASERMERMQEQMDDLESKFQEITKYLQENPPSPENQPLVKEWHRQLSPEIRDHLARKLVNAILPSSCPCEDRIKKKLDAYARKVENEIWEAANSKSEYYHLLAEKYYKISKEIDERRRRRLNARRL